MAAGSRLWWRLIELFLKTFDLDWDAVHARYDTPTGNSTIYFYYHLRHAMPAPYQLWPTCLSISLSVTSRILSKQRNGSIWFLAYTLSWTYSTPCFNLDKDTSIWKWNFVPDSEPRETFRHGVSTRQHLAMVDVAERCQQQTDNRHLFVALGVQLCIQCSRCNVARISQRHWQLRLVKHCSGTPHGHLRVFCDQSSIIHVTYLWNQ